MKNLFAVLMFLAVGAKAEGVFTVGYSTFAVQAVTINTASAGAVLVNSRPSGFAANIGFYRFSNSHPSWDIYVGDVNVSTSVFSANVGEVVKANGGKVEWPVAKDYRRNGAFVPIYAVAADTAGTETRPRLSVIWFGY